MTVSAQIDAHLRRLTPAERRVAAVVADDPEAVAFGTVADVARRAGASGATVVRLATKLGFDGFVELQASVREELARRLRPASERIRRPAAGDVIGAALAVEMANVASTLESVDRAAFETAVDMLSGVPATVRRSKGGGGGRHRPVDVRGRVDRERSDVLGRPGRVDGVKGGHACTPSVAELL